MSGPNDHHRISEIKFGDADRYGLIEKLADFAGSNSLGDGATTESFPGPVLLCEIWRNEATPYEIVAGNVVGVGTNSIVFGRTMDAAEIASVTWNYRAPEYIVNGTWDPQPRSHIQTMTRFLREVSDSNPVRGWVPLQLAGYPTPWWPRTFLTSSVVTEQDLLGFVSWRRVRWAASNIRAYQPHQTGVEVDLSWINCCAGGNG